MIYLRTQGRHCIALVHSELKEDLSQWFWCKKIWFVLIFYWLAELASSPVVTSDKWPYLLCYYVQHNHAKNSQRNIEPTFHWLHDLYLFEELKDVFCPYSTAEKVWKRAHWQTITPLFLRAVSNRILQKNTPQLFLFFVLPKLWLIWRWIAPHIQSSHLSFYFLLSPPYSFRSVLPPTLKWLVMQGL